MYQAILCPKIDKLQQEYFRSPEVKTLLREHSELLEYLENNSRMKLQSFKGAALFHDPFKSMKKTKTGFSILRDFRPFQ